MPSLGDSGIDVLTASLAPQPSNSAKRTRPPSITVFGSDKPGKMMLCTMMTSWMGVMAEDEGMSLW